MRLGARGRWRRPLAPSRDIHPCSHQERHVTLDDFRQHFDVPRACEELRSLNRASLFAAADFVVDRQFDAYQALPVDEVQSAFMLLDRTWATRLAFDQGALDVLTSAYVGNRDLYDQCFRDLREVSLEKHPERVYEIASKLLQTLLSPDGDHVVNQHYSFASKVFHWHAPQHLPIVDSRARMSINALQRQCSVRQGRVLASTAEMRGGTYIQEYHRWVAFYSQLLRALSARDRQQLLAADRASLPSRFRLENTLLRVLDKVFYYRGGRAGSDIRD